uniref:T-complex 11, testis-specific-like 2 n=1 Tax=Periophthalmus magnuspinnatus TaxID=409849 RepID=A0A3B3ZXR6_9GOBI
MELIKQEVSQGALDLNRLAAYVINTMGSLCAPVRDQEIRALHHLQEPVELFRGIFHMLGLMKIDMVNFTVQTLRPHLMQQAVQYERAKFKQILDKDPGEEGLRMSSVRDGPVSAMSVLNRAYMHLLRWSSLDQKYPETVLMDRVRLDSLGEQVRSLVLDASVLLVTHAQCGGAVWSLPGFVGKLKQSITALEADLRGALLRVAEKVVQQVNEARCSQENTADFLSFWIYLDNVGERVQGFLQAMLQGGPPKKSPELASPLRLLSADLAELGRAFGQIVHFNRSVFGPFYAPILRRALIPSEEPKTQVECLCNIQNGRTFVTNEK